MSFRSKKQASAASVIAPALESSDQGRSPETEVTIYAQIGDMHGLEECVRKEKQVQLETQYLNGVPARVRKTSDESGDRYVHTFKIKVGESAGVPMRKEENVTVPESFFESWKAVAGRMLVKTRYVFESTKVTLTLAKGEEKREVTVPNVVYEVDVYEMEDGQPCPYCKIDVEIDSILAFINEHEPDLKSFKLLIKTSHLPFHPLNPMIQGDPKHKDKIDEIWKSYIRKVA